MKIAAYDPGVTTGWAAYDGTNFHVGEIKTPMAIDAYRHVNGVDPDELGWEDFKHRPTLIKAELHSIKIISALELWVQFRMYPTPTFSYLPARAKKFWDDSKIKKLGLWKPGQGHAMDALRVLLTHLERTDQVWFANMLTKLR